MKCLPLAQWLPGAADEDVGRAVGHGEGLEHVRLRPAVDPKAGHQLAGVVCADLSQLRGDGVERLVPADTLPLRIDPPALLRVGPLERVVEPVGIVEDVDAAQAPGADAALGQGIVRVALDLGDHSVDAVRLDRAEREAVGTDRGDPDVFLDAFSFHMTSSVWPVLPKHGMGAPGPQGARSAEERLPPPAAAKTMIRTTGSSPAGKGRPRSSTGFPPQ